MYHRVMRLIERNVQMLSREMGNLIPDKYKYTMSYSQCGEDRIVNTLLTAVLGIKSPSYLDCGAHDPYYLSNTALFYRRGFRGINVEANPICFKKISAARREDVNLNVAIGADSGTADFYIIDPPSLSTLSRSEAERFEKECGHYIKAIIKIPVMTINEIIEKYADGIFPDFLSVDVEGLDLEILQQIDFANSAPKIVCVETIEYKPHGRALKDEKIVAFLESKGYLAIADTYINTIFIQKMLWEQA